jgi:hypothetical protein
LIDFHVHSAPSLVPRHHTDLEIDAVLGASGIDRFVMKAHEGSTAERAMLVGNGAIGSIVLNSPVGGANPDAVEVAARLGARVVWLPTISSRVHKAAHAAPELNAHHGVNFREVAVVEDGRLLEPWYEVLDLVAEHDLILASGHLSMDEAVAVFEVAAQRGVQRLLVNHPLLPFLGWRDDHIDQLDALGAFIEVGVLADHLAASADGLSATLQLAAAFDDKRLVFGSDLGHTSFPDVKPGVDDWLRQAESTLGDRRVELITSANGKELLQP